MPSISEEDIAAVVEVLRSGWLTTGARAKQFEREFAEYVGVKHAVAMNSATAALHLGLDAIGLQRGEDVLVPTMTFAATAEVVRYFDARPVLLDVDPDTLNLTPATVEAYLEEHAEVRDGAAYDRKTGARIRAIVPVHFGGLPVDMPAMMEVANRFSVTVNEDAAHTLPASIDGRSVGTYGKANAFSFYANKNITTGEGGMLVTDDDAVADRARIMCLHGISRDAWQRFTAQGSWYYEIVAPGYKYNLTDIAAALGLSQMKRVGEFLEGRTNIARHYDSLFADNEIVRTPSWGREGVVHSWHLYPIRLRTEQLSISRAEFIDAMKAKGIGTSVHYTPLHMHPYYRENYGYTPDDLPVAKAQYEGLITLPLYPKMTSEDVEYVASTVNDLVAQHRR